VAQVWRHCPVIAVAFALAGAFFAPASAQDQSPNAGTDLYDPPVLVVDPDMHSAAIRSQAIDASDHYAVTGGLDRTVRVWSLANGSLFRTIRIPIGPNPVGVVNAVAISGDGAIIAVGGHTETLSGEHPVYVFDRETGSLIRRIGDNLLTEVNNLTFSPDGRFLAVMLAGTGGLRIFDRNNDWTETFRDDTYGANGYWTSFARNGRLATTSKLPARSAPPTLLLARMEVCSLLVLQMRSLSKF
jgi:WD40 repeat protein